MIQTKIQKRPYNEEYREINEIYENLFDLNESSSRKKKADITCLDPTTTKRSKSDYNEFV